MSPEQIRIVPPNATIRELNIPKEKLEPLEKIVYSPKIADKVKVLMIKKYAEVSPCCICGGIPSLEVVYQLEDIKRVERYCSKCIERVYSREQVL